ncbi:DUF2666 family protein [archaeon]|nr:DUF2666 family protein [archaeon]
MPDSIEFTAQVGKWICVKRHTPDDSQPIGTASALASIHDSMDRKIWEFFGREFPLEPLDKIVYEITGAEFDSKKKTRSLKGRKTEEQIAAALAKLNSPSTTSKLAAKTDSEKELKKTYVTRRVLDLLGFRIELDPAVAEKYLKDKANLS